MCEVLEVSRSGYHGWVGRSESARTAADRALAAEIRASRGRYGSPRVHAQLRAHGHRIGRKRVARLMRGMGLQPDDGDSSAAPRTAPTPSNLVFADAAYAGERVANATCITVQIVRKPDDQIGFKVHKRRWVVV